jgi:hypothetical protein
MTARGGHEYSVMFTGRYQRVKVKLLPDLDNNGDEAVAPQHTALRIILKFLSALYDGDVDRHWEMFFVIGLPGDNGQSLSSPNLT